MSEDPFVEYYTREEVDTVTISRSEYLNLIESAKFLEALENAGVDNWSGYSFALELLEDTE